MSETIGLDIGTYSIKLVKLKRRGKNFSVVDFGAAYNPVGQVIPADGRQQQQLAVAVKKLVTEHKISGESLVMALPDTAAFTNVITMPALSDTELSSAIKWEAEQHVPVPLDQVNLEYEVLYRPKKRGTSEKMEILLVAAQKNMIKGYVALAEAVGIEVKALETEVIAAIRSLFRREDQSISLVCHFGATSVGLAVVHLSRLAMTHSVPVAGLALTRAIESGLGLDASRAEEYKRTYGLDGAQLEGKVRGAMLPVMERVLSEIRKTLQFFATQRSGVAVQRVILSGGSAHLPGLATYMAELLALEVVVGNPFEGMEGRVKLPGDYAAYSVCVGLAEREEL